MIACMNTLAARATLCHPEGSEGSFATLRMTLCGHAHAPRLGMRLHCNARACRCQEFPEIPEDCLQMEQEQHQRRFLRRTRFLLRASREARDPREESVT